MARRNFAGPARNLTLLAMVVAPGITAAVVSNASVSSAHPGFAGSTSAPLARRAQTTELISRASDGGIPNGPSTHGVISGDRRFARVIAFQSQASNIVPRDKNGQEDVFAVYRGGAFADNMGSAWEPARTELISRAHAGGSANGPSFAPAIGGSLYRRPRCIAFLSAASNLVSRDTNSTIDAFVSWGPGRKTRRLLLPRERQAHRDVTAVAVSGDCSRTAFVSAGRLYVQAKGRTRRLSAPGVVADPSFSSGKGD